MRHDYTQLETLLKSYTNKGMEIDEIVDELVNLGFNESVIRLVAKHLHEPSNRIKELSEWAHEQIMKAKDKEELKEILMDANWKEEIIDLVLNIHD